jgi:hypothetical protein
LIPLLIVSLFFIASLSTFAANPSSPFSPADRVLDPNCSPLDSNCYVSITSLTLTNSTTTNATSTNLFSNNIVSNFISVGSPVTSAPTAFLSKNALSNNNLFAHGFAEEGSYTSLGTTGGYASFSAATFIAGSTPFDHFHGFQFLPTITGSHTINEVSGYFTTPTVATGTTITNLNGAYIGDFIGGGTITNNYGVYIAPIVKGINNYGLYGSGANDKNYLAGNLGIGTLTPNTKLHVAADVLGIAGNNPLQLTISGATNVNKQLRVGYDTVVNSGVIQSETLGSSWDSLSLNPNGGNVGIGTTTPTEKLSVIGNGLFSGILSLGGNVSSSDDSGILIHRSATNPLSNGGSHGLRDESTYSAASSGGYASFDSIPTISGSIVNSHVHSYQARPSFTTSNIMTESAGLTYQPTHNGTGTITNSYGVRMSDALGTGPITTQVGLWCDPLTRGTGNYCIYDSGTSANYLGGSLQIGGALQSATARLTGIGSTYGAILSHDASGLVLDNSNLTIINGTMDMSNGSNAKLLASASNLQLESTSGNILFRPGAVTAGTFLANGKLGIGTTSPLYLLHVGSSTVSGVVARFQNSTGYCDINPTTTSLSCTSDARLKKNVISIDNLTTLDKLTQLNPVMYNWITEDDASSTHAGFIAQQVQVLLPDLVSTDAQGTLSVSYAGFVPYIVQSIKTLASRVAEFTNVFHTKTLCVGENGNETCITKSQLDAMLQNANQQSQPSPTPIIEPTSTSTQSTSSSTPESTSTTTDPVVNNATTTETNASSTETN